MKQNFFVLRLRSQLSFKIYVSFDCISNFWTRKTKYFQIIIKDQDQKAKMKFDFTTSWKERTNDKT